MIFLPIATTKDIVDSFYYASRLGFLNWDSSYQGI